MPRSLAGLEQIYADKTATFLEFNALAIHAAHVVWLSFTKRQSRYMIDHGQNLLGCLLVGAGEVKEEDREQNVHESMSMHGFVSSDVERVVNATP